MRILLFIACVALAITAQSKPSDPDQGGENPAPAAQGADKQVTQPPAPVVVNIVPPENIKVETHQNADDRTRGDESERRALILNGVLAVIVFLQLIVFGCQGIQLRRTVTEMKRQFLGANPAKLIIQRVYTVDSPGTGEWIGNKSITAIKFTIFNKGKTTIRRIISSNVKHGMETVGMTPIPIYDGEPIDCGTSDFRAGRKVEFTYKLGAEIGIPALKSSAGFASNAENMIFFGFISYEDLSGVERHTHFYRIYDVEADRFKKIKDSDLENTD